MTLLYCALVNCLRGAIRNSSQELSFMHTVEIDVVEDIVHILTDALLVRFHRVDSSDFKSQLLHKSQFFLCDLRQDT